MWGHFVIIDVRETVVKHNLLLQLDIQAKTIFAEIARCPFHEVVTHYGHVLTYYDIRHRWGYHHILLADGQVET